MFFRDTYSKSLASFKIYVGKHDDDTPLHIAAKYNHLQIVQLLLSKGAEVDSRNTDNDTPLHIAARYNHLQIVQLLLSKGAELDSRNTDDDTPLHVAARTNYLQIVELLLSKGAEVDSRNTDKSKPVDVKYSTEIRSTIRNYGKTKKNTIVALQKCITKAKNQKGKVNVKFIKILFTGSGKAGKTSFTNLLMKNKFVNFHHSTNIVHAKHAVSVKKAFVVGSNQCDDQNIVWLEMNDESQISHLRQILLSLDISSLKKLQTVKEPKSSSSTSTQPNNTKFTNTTASYGQSNNVQEGKKEYVTHQSSSVVQRVTGLFQGSVKSEKMETFNSLVQNSVSSNVFKEGFNYHGEVFNIITLLDTGGQPEYIHLLPTVNIHPMINFVVYNLTQSLKDQVLVEYSEHGKSVFQPYHLKYSNFDMIKFLMSSINDSLERALSQVPQLATIPGKINNSYLCCVGTHADKIGQDTIQNIDSQLTAMVEKLECKASVWHKEGGGVLFPVNNTTAGNDAKEDPMANFIRNEIDKLSRDKDIYELPITWMLFEMEIRKVCSNNDKAYMSFKECSSIAIQTNLIPNIEEVKSALIYHHLLGVLLYYRDVPGLCDYVIIDHQWLFDRISSIVCFTFKNMHATNTLKYNGILTKELIQNLDWKEELKEEYFIALLVEMKIIAPIQREDGNGENYFIPYILPTYTLHTHCDDIFISQYGCLQGEPLLIQFVSNLLPRGFFCCLVVQILQQLPKGWNHLITQRDTYHTYSNLITFTLQGAYFLSLLDRLSFLEIQIRHQKNAYYKQFPIHLEVQDILAKALVNVCDQLNFNHGRLQYGFHCKKKCGSINEAHIAVLTKLTPPFDYYAMCRYGSTSHTELTCEHTIWLTQKVNHSDLATDNLPPDHAVQPSLAGNWNPEATKKVYKDFRIKLITSLPMGDAIFLELIRKQNLFPGDLQEQVQAKTTKAEKTSWFLDNAIEPSLHIDKIEPLHKLLTVMTDDEYLNSDLLRELAAEIIQQLVKETSLLSTIAAGQQSLECKLFTEYYSKLVYTLPASDLSHYFVSEKIISLTDHERIIKSAVTQDAAKLLLDKVSLQIQNGNTSVFSKMLLIMDYHGVNTAKTISLEIRKRLSLVKCEKESSSLSPEAAPPVTETTTPAITEHSAEYEVFICYYSQIVNSLSAETLSPYFVAQNIITSAEQMEIFSVPSPIKAAGLLLSKIACALDAEITEDFYKFLDITEQYGSIDSKTVTAAMRKELLEMKSTKHKGTDDDSSKSVDSPPDPAGEDSETNTQ